MTIQLRDYQAEAIDGIYEWFGRERSNPLIVVPTGGGKSVILAEFIRRVLADFPHERILCVTHVKELIEQNEAAMLRVWPRCPTGVYSAGVRRREKDAQVLFAGVQSIHSKADKLGWIDLAIVDEAHLIPKKGMGMYRTLFNDLRATNANLKVIGLTATPFRTGEGRLDSGEGAMFGGIAYECDIERLINDGYLSRIRNKGCRSGEIDTDGVRKQGGDFIQRELEKAADREEVVRAAVEELVERGRDRKSWLVFCCGIQHARHVADLLDEHGITCGTVFGNTSKDDRVDTIERFKRGDLRCIVNVNVLTTGFDAPQVDLVAMLRPTLSPVLYVQMVGRGLRIAEGKEDCLLLDFGANVMRHGPINAINVRDPKPREVGSMPAKKCPVCEELVAIGSMQCPACGYEWEEDPAPPHKDIPDEESEVIALKKDRFETLDVTGCDYELWRSRSGEGKPPTMRVTYWCGLGRQVSEWVCLEHPPGSFPRRKAEDWWRNAGGAHPPSTIDEAVVRAKECGALQDPVRVIVDHGGKYPTIVSVERSREPGSYEPDATPVSGSVDLDDLPF